MGSLRGEGSRGRRVTSLLLLLATAGAARGQEAGETEPVPSLREPMFLLSVGAIVDPGDHADDPRILGAAGEFDLPDQSLTQSDQVYVARTLEGVPLGPGDAVQFFRLTRQILDPDTHASLGRLLVPTGVGHVDSLTGELARVRILHAFQPVLVGDRARAVSAGDTVAAGGASAGGAAAGIVIDFQEEKAIYPPFDILFLRLASPGALAVGAPVLLYRDGAVVGDRRLPDVLIARARVVRVDGSVAAAALVEAMRSDLRRGDRFRLDTGTP